MTVVQRTGWHEIEGENVFVLPGECIGPKRVGRVLLDGAAHGPYETKGTLAEWREGVATLAAGHAIPMLAISTAFAGPLLHLAGLEGGGLQPVRAIQPRQNHMPASSRERLGTRRHTGLRPSLARNQQRPGGRCRAIQRYRDDPRRAGHG